MTNELRFGRRSVLTLGGAGLVGLAASPLYGQQVFKEIHELLPGEFTWHPERQPVGPVAVVVSLDEQRAHIYRNGVRIGVSTCSTGRPGHDTPTGVFVVLQKDRDHRSSTYNNAPMPNMNRLTWDGIALHAGNLPGYPASHGCVRLPFDFSALLFEVTHVGTPVVIAASNHDPTDVVHPGLILSGYAEQEFEEVLSTLEPRKHPVDWEEGDSYPIVSIIASSTDAQLLVLEDNREVLHGELIWDGEPLGSHVFTLKGSNKAAKGMHWEALTYDVMSQAGVPDLSRISASPEFNQALKRYVHPGMFFVLTDLPLHPDRRSGRDFVIMS